MRYFVWILRLLVFVIVLLFALKNTEPVSVNFFANYVFSDIPLIVVMLCAVVLGLILGLLIMVSVVLRKKRDIAKLKREVARLEEAISHPLIPANAVAPETVAPLAPL